MIIISNHFIVSLDFLSHQLSVDSKFIEFRVHLSPQFNVRPSTVHFQSEFEC